MILESPASESPYRFVFWLWARGGPTVHTCMRGFANTCDPARLSADFSTHVYRHASRSVNCTDNLLPSSESSCANACAKKVGLSEIGIRRLHLPITHLPRI